MADTVPAGVPDAAADAARDTPGGAAEAGDGLPLQLASDLLDAGREAFTAALQATALTAAATTAAAAVLAATLLRRVRGSTA
jgi:DHA2 family multidrug resistance protein-like MFS transporter